MRVEEDESSFRLSNGGTLDWTIPKRSLKLLESVKTPEKEFLRASGSGLKLRLKDGTLHEVSGPLSARILKRGPIAASVRLEWSEEVASGSPIRGAVDLEVPRAKSWVRAQISIQDPRRVVAGLEVALDLVVGNEPLLVDLGTPGGVYASLQRGQAVRLAAKPDALKPWEALKGEVGKARALRDGPSRRRSRGGVGSFHGRQALHGARHRRLRRAHERPDRGRRRGRASESAERSSTILRRPRRPGTSRYGSISSIRPPTSEP
jgi:hypothetical protein